MRVLCTTLFRHGLVQPDEWLNGVLHGHNAVRDCFICCSTGNVVARRMLVAVLALE